MSITTVGPDIAKQIFLLHAAQVTPHSPHKDIRFPQSVTGSLPCKISI